MSFRTASLVAAAVLFTAAPAFSVDGSFALQEGPSYYEATAESEAVATSAETTDGAASGGLPTSLYVVDGAGRLAYDDLGNGSWQLDVELVERPLERVDAVYDLVLALPLPLGSRASSWRIAPKMSPTSTEQIVYGGEPIVLKRNVPLEQAWLPLLAGAPGGLPDLSRSGYAWTFWDAIVRYDPAAGATIQAYGTFRYRTNASVVAPDAENPDNAAYVITWIPTLEAVPPFAIRLDVVDGGEE
jgi:hypothetical protein